MSAIAIFSLVTQGLKLINFIIGWLEKKKYITEGMKRQLAKDSAEVARKGKIMKELKAKTEEMSDEDLHNILVD